MRLGSRRLSATVTSGDTPAAQIILGSGLGLVREYPPANEVERAAVFVHWPSPVPIVSEASPVHQHFFLSGIWYG
jgi:hypothetical protein